MSADLPKRPAGPDVDTARAGPPATNPTPGETARAEADRAERDHDARHLLHLYLRDHWALAGAGAARAERVYRANRETPWAHQLERIHRELRSDDATLQRVRRALGNDRGRIERTAALAAERLGRLKLNGRLVSYSPLSRVLEAELLLAGILAKQRLWTTLAAVLGPERAGADFEQLIERAGSQLTTLEAFHQWAVAEAFEPPGTARPTGPDGAGSRPEATRANRSATDVA